MSDVFVVDGCRTPIGRHRGTLSAIRPDDLAAIVVRGLLDRNPALDPQAVADVVMGAANQAGEDNRNVARMAALLAGLGAGVAGVTVNRLCASGLEAVNQAAAALALGHGEVAIAGGSESMSRAPYVLPRADERLARKHELVDTTLGWRLVNPAMPAAHTISLGLTAEVVAEEWGITRDDQDEFALRSHHNAVAAQDAGAFAHELVPVTTADGLQVTTDEGPRRDTDRTALARLKPAFAPNGTVTAGNSSGINDGAAAALLATEAGIARHGLSPLARIVDWAVTGVEPRRMGIGPAPATRKVLDRAGWRLDDLQLVELNEAFAAQCLAVIADLGLESEVVNSRGGAIALGHPLGCSGARLVVTLAHQLAERPPGTKGAATMCVGVGQGVTTLLERV